MDSSSRASEIVSDSGFQLWSVKPHLITLANPSTTQKWTYHRWHVHTGEWENGREQMQLTIAFDSDWFRMWHEGQSPSALMKNLKQPRNYFP